MGCRAVKLAGAPLLLVGLAACGGEDASGTSGGPTTSPTPPPAPAPSPSPTPTPAAFEPVAVQLFDEALYNSELRTLGHGSVADLTGSATSTPFDKVIAADDLKITYDATAQVYRADANIAGQGTLFQVGPDNLDQVPAVVETELSAARDASPEIYLRRAGPTRDYRFVAWASPWTTTNPGLAGSKFYYGSFGVAQPTKPADVPAAGTARYSGGLFGWFTDDPGGTGLTGPVTLDFDFASLTGEGQFSAAFYCMMGCGYPDVAYSMAITKRTTANSFEGEISLAGGARKGRFSGIMAGPGAAEMLLEITFTYASPERKADATFAGIVIAKRTG